MRTPVIIPPWLTISKAAQNQSARPYPPANSPMHLAVYGTRTKVYHIADTQTFPISKLVVRSKPCTEFHKTRNYNYYNHLCRRCSILFSGTPNNLEQLKIYAETSLKIMKEWYSENGLKMNSNKTQCILFATPNFNKLTETFQITIDDTVRHMEDKVKNLEVIFESHLSFEHHIKSLCSRLNGTLSYLNRVKNTLDQKSNILLINALIFSHLNY